LIISGTPMRSASAAIVDGDASSPAYPGRQGTPARWAISFARTLSPSASIASADGPTKTMPAASQARAKAAFSERKP